MDIEIMQRQLAELTAFRQRHEPMLELMRDEASQHRGAAEKLGIPYKGDPKEDPAPPLTAPTQGEGASTGPGEPAARTANAARAELDDGMTRAELEGIAAAEGVTDYEDAPNKAELIKLIEANRSKT